MNKFDRENPHQDEILTRRVFWVTVIYTLVALSSVGLAVLLLTRFQIWQVYVMAIIAVASLGFDFAAVILIRQQREELALKILYWSSLITVPINVLLFDGVVAFLIPMVLVVGFVNVFYLFPISWRKKYQLGPIIAAVVMLVVDLINPAFRVNLANTSGSFGFITLGFIILGTTFLVIRFAWATSIRTRFLAFSLTLTLVTMAVIAAITVNSLISSSDLTQQKTGNALQTQAQDYLVQLTIDNAEKNALILEKTQLDARNMAQYASQVFDNPEAFNTTAFWNADEHMFFGPDGQYINGPEDTSTVFIPNTVTLNDDFKTTLDLSAYLDLNFVSVFENNPNAAAIYFISKEEISRLYPNINLGEIVPPDFLATQDIFYTIGTPENDPQREVVWTPVYDDPAGQGLLVSAIAPIYNAQDEFLGIIGIDISLAGLTENIESSSLASGGYSFLVNPSGRALALPSLGYQDILGRERQPDEFGPDLAKANPAFSPVLTEMTAGITGFQSVTVDEREFYLAYAPIKNTGWAMASVVEANQVLEPANALQAELTTATQSLIYQQILPAAIVLIIAVLIIGVVFTNQLVKPIEQVANGAVRIGDGDWDTPLPDSQLSEMSKLTTSLRQMATQLKGTLGLLEQRVADATRDLELAAEVGQTVALLRNPDTMLSQAADLIRERFDLYYTQIYLVDATGRTIILSAGTGEVGQMLIRRNHRLPVDLGSINGTAVVERHAVIVEDTEQSAIHRANPLLPDTRSEMAVPMLAGNRVVGVIDLQSSQPGALSTANLAAFEALAGQLAIAIVNLNLIAEVEQARTAIEEQARRLSGEGWHEFLDALHHKEFVGYSFEEATFTPLIEPLAEDEDALIAPIRVSGESVGKFQFKSERPWTEDDTLTIAAVSRQVAQQIENLRLLSQSQRYQEEAQEALRRLTRESWESFQAQKEIAPGFIYDQQEVRPLVEEDLNAEIHLAYNIQLRGETIGQFSIAGAENLNEDDLQLVQAISEQLSAHLENLRLSQQTEQALAETEELYRGSEQLVRAKTYDEILEVLIHATRLEDLDLISLMLVDSWNPTGGPETLLFVSNWTKGILPETIPTGTRLKTDNMPIAKNLAPGQPVIIPDYYAAGLSEESLERVRESGARGAAILPLFVSDRLIGLVSASSAEIFEWNEDDIRLAMAFAGQAAITIQNQRLFEQTEQALAETEEQAKHLNALNVISAEVVSQTEIMLVYQTVVESLVNNFEMAFARIWVYEPITNELILQVSAGMYTHLDGTHSRVPLDSDRKLAWIAKQNQSHVSNDILNDPRVDDKQWAQNEGMRAFAGYPLRAGNELLGVLGMFSYQPIEERTQLLLESLAVQVGTVVNTQLLFRQSQDQAERLATLNELSERLTNAENLEAILNTTARYLDKIIPAQRTSITWPSGDGKTLEVFALQGEAGAIPTGAKLPIEKTMIGTAFTERRVLISPDLSQSDYFENPMLIKQGLRSSMCVPLLTVDHTLGTLNFGSQYLDAFSNRDRDLAIQAASLISGIIENQELFAQTQAALSQTERLYEVGRKLNLAANADQILDAVSGVAIESGCSQASLRMIDSDLNDTPEWMTQSAIWMRKGEPTTPVGSRFYIPEFPFARTLLIDPNKPQLISDVTQDDRIGEAFKPIWVQSGSLASAIIPLAQAGRWLGVIIFNWDQPHEFSHAEETIYEALISLATPAVQSRRLLTQAQTQAQREQALRQITSAVRASNDPTTIMRTAVRELGTLLGRKTIIKMAQNTPEENPDNGNDTNA